MKLNMRLPVVALALVALASPALAMDGVNTDTGDAVTVDDGTEFTVGNVIALFDADGNEMDVEIQAVNDKGDAIDVDVVDQDSGDTATVEFSK
jgi:hypothetical protein